MLRPGSTRAAALVALIVLHEPVRGADDPIASNTETVLRFVQGLRERGYYDLTLEYLEQLRQMPEAPADLKGIIDYEMGRSLLEQAARVADLEVQLQQLEQARAKLDAFTKANPKHPQVPEALVQLARVIVERGHRAVIMADEAKNAAEKQASLTEARKSFGQARAAYDKAKEPLKTAFDAFPKFIPDGDSRKEARRRVHSALMEAELQRALVDYEEACSYPLGSKERNSLLDRGIEQFKGVYEAYREQMAGLYARMWQGKCYEEKGELGPAMGIYNELMGHNTPELRPLQRQVDYFRIIVLAKRKEYALAADEAVRWLQANTSVRRSEEWLGVELELAKNILAQLDSLKGAEREAALRKAIDALSEAVRYYSKYKPEALALLQKYRPRTADAASIPANLTYDDAVSQAEEAISLQEWNRAIPLLKAAIRRADPTKDIEKVNRARYLLAFAYYQSEHYYEADVLAEHLARRYPRGGLSAKATSLGMAALTFAYNTYTARDQTTDLDRLIDLANYTAETYPDTEQGDAARFTLGEILLGKGEYPQAAQAYESVRKESSRHADAQTKAGAAHWKQSLVLREEDKTSEADAQLKAAFEILKAALKERQDAGAQPTDPGLVGNACDLAEIELATDRAKDALAMLEPLAARAAGAAKPPPERVPVVSRLLATLLRTHVSSGLVDKALEDMNRLESLGGPASSLTQLYFELGQLLKKEMDSLQLKGNQAGFDRTQQAYQKFLQALVKSKAGQSYTSLEWAGEQLLTLSESANAQAESLRTGRMVRQAGTTADSARSLAGEASAVFQSILDTYSKDDDFRKARGGEALLMRTKLKLAGAYRNQREFGKADELIKELIEQNRGLLDPLMEKGHLLEAQAQAGSGQWALAYEHWRRLASRLGQATPKPVDYFEASYHVAYCLLKQNQPAEAKRALNSVMRLSPKVGNEEMKAKYESLLRQLGT
jgi:outer membrane protein assembly factor BamD (BamD/ComL family)